MESDFRYSLLENGLDFVLSSLEHLTAASAFTATPPHAKQLQQKRHLKYALLHLCSGIELIFKERLRQEDWQLIFNNVEEADEKVYESGDFKSVYFNDAKIDLPTNALLTLAKHSGGISHASAVAVIESSTSAL
jgi:hypothetical protein